MPVPWPLAAKLALGLRTVGRYERFAPNIISASLVSHGKPAPDVFIFAAGWMKAPIAGCLVIEDSVHGVRAAVAAGMQVFGFTGGRHARPALHRRLQEAGAALVFDDFRALPSLLSAAF